MNLAGKKRKFNEARIKAIALAAEIYQDPDQGLPEHHGLPLAAYVLVSDLLADHLSLPLFKGEEAGERRRKRG